LKAATINKVEAFEMWTLRRMLRVSWVDLVTNQNILRRAGLVDRELFENIKRRKTASLGGTYFFENEFIRLWQFFGRI